MESESIINVVRNLTRLVVERYCPCKLTNFEEDFAACSLKSREVQVSEPPPAPLVPRSENLDTTLVAGMFFKVMQDAARLPATIQERISFVRKKAKDYLVNHFAGEITLSQFYRLLNLIEEEVGSYFIGRDWVGGRSRPVEGPLGHPTPAASEDNGALRQALARIHLPLKGRRKITPEALADFLRETGGGWFRLLDFEARFRVNKKTAWGYLHLLLKAGILTHNGEKANRVRYALAAPLRPPAAGPAASAELP